MKDLEYEKGIPITYIAGNLMRVINSGKVGHSAYLRQKINCHKRQGHVDSPWHSYQSSF